jgi:hypothetical protein
MGTTNNSRDDGDNGEVVDPDISRTKGRGEVGVNEEINLRRSSDG